MTRFRSKSGMTFFEIFMVIIILGVLMSGITALARHSRHASDVARARADIAELTEVIDRYARTFGEVPLDGLDESLKGHDGKYSDTADESWALTNLWALDDRPLPYPRKKADGAEEANWDWQAELMAAATNVDPWGRSYRYRPITRETDDDEELLEGFDAFEVFSYGPHLKKDGSGFHTNDDIRISM